MQPCCLPKVRPLDRTGKSDGVAIEFYQVFWDKLGPTIQVVINQVVREGYLHEEITTSLIILLHKRGDHCLLSNKRGLTLLNALYKILTKALQIRLMPILMRIIFVQQSVFLLDRSIHHNVLLVNKLLYRASMEEDDLVALKLDMYKAFDMMEWLFLFVLLAHLGFRPSFITALHAIFGSAASAILINGRRNCPFQITHSVRQGCPLSPLLFILVADVLSRRISKEITWENIVGLHLPEENLHEVHGMYTDDMNLILKGNLENIQNCHSIFNQFGRASGLFCNWTSPKAVFISRNPMPQELRALNWTWETGPNHSKLLGFYIGENISHEQMVQQIQGKMEESIGKAKPSSLAAVMGVFYVEGVPRDKTCPRGHQANLSTINSRRARLELSIYPEVNLTTIMSTIISRWIRISLGYSKHGDVPRS